MTLFNKAFLYGVVMFALGLSAGNYRAQLSLTEKVDSLPTVAMKAVAPVEQRIVSLPEDGKQYYTSLFLPSNWQADPKSRELRAWFDTNITLTSLKAQTHFNVITPTDPQWGPKYASSVGKTLPCIALTDATGDVVYKATQAAIPGTSNTLAAAIHESVQRRCPNRRCPAPEPVTPAPEPSPNVPDTNPVLPDTNPVLTVPEHEFPLWLGILLAVGGIAGAVVPDIVKKYKAVG